MAVLKFRVFLEEDDTVYRDIAIKHNQTFYEFHLAILSSFEFDSIHPASFYRSNDSWQRGRAISIEKYEGQEYKVEPLDMFETTLGSEIKDTEQKFVYLYDFVKNWTFLIQLIGVSKEESSKISYPAITRKEGIGPSQYGIKSILGDRFADVEEKYDLSALGEAFLDEGETGEAGEDSDNKDEDSGAEDQTQEEDNSF
jgi:hypothetical protein